MLTRRSNHQRSTMMPLTDRRMSPSSRTSRNSKSPGNTEPCIGRKRSIGILRREKRHRLQVRDDTNLTGQGEQPYAAAAAAILMTLTVFVSKGKKKTLQCKVLECFKVVAWFGSGDQVLFRLHNMASLLQVSSVLICFMVVHIVCIFLSGGAEHQPLEKFLWEDWVLELGNEWETLINNCSGSSNIWSKRAKPLFIHNAIFSPLAPRQTY